MTRKDKIAAAKRHIAGKIGDILEKNFDEAGGALEEAGTFTALLEAWKAVEIAERSETDEERARDAAAYKEGIMKNIG